MLVLNLWFSLCGFNYVIFSIWCFISKMASELHMECETLSLNTRQNLEKQLEDIRLEEERLDRELENQNGRNGGMTNDNQTGRKGGMTKEHQKGRTGGICADLKC